MDLSIRFCLLFVAAIVTKATAIDWQTSGGVRWSLNCNFHGNDLTSQRGKGEDCGGICQSNSQCTHFTWTDFNEGTCWLKSGDISPNNAVDKFDSFIVCGYIINKILNGIKWQTSGGVRWSMNCNFHGNDLTSQRSRGEDCGEICQSNSQCTHFTWTDFNEGTCWLKSGSISPHNAVDKSDSLIVCGYVINRISTFFNWKTSGDVRWSWDCDFNGNDFTSEASRGKDCPGICEANSRCTHFAWTNYNGGTCWLKKGPVSANTAFIKTTESSLCGYVDSRKFNIDTGDLVSGIKGTLWVIASDAEGCQMPSGDYVVTDAIALGQADQLGSLKWRQGLCGQVVRVDCGNGPIDTVVASTCHLSSNTCGIEMISKTWRKATNNHSSGIAQCTVQRTTRNPLRESFPLCFYRPNSDTSNRHFAIIGLLNTSGKITSSATLAGVQGRRNKDGWFAFYAHSHPLFHNDVEAIFHYEDGSSTSIKLGDCRSGGKVKIF